MSEKYHELYFDDDEWLSAATYVQSLLNKRHTECAGRTAAGMQLKNAHSITALLLVADLQNVAEY